MTLLARAAASVRPWPSEPRAIASAFESPFVTTRPWSVLLLMPEAHAHSVRVRCVPLTSWSVAPFFAEGRAVRVGTGSTWPRELPSTVGAIVLF